MFKFLQKVLISDYFPDTFKELIGYISDDEDTEDYVLYVVGPPNASYFLGDQIKFAANLKKDPDHTYVLWNTSKDNYLELSDLAVCPESDMSIEYEISLLEVGTVCYQMVKLKNDGTFISTYGNKITLNVLPHLS